MRYPREARLYQGRKPKALGDGLGANDDGHARLEKYRWSRTGL